MNWVIRIVIYTLPCIQWLARGKLLCGTGSSAWCSVMAYVSRMGAGGRCKKEEIYAYLS